MKRARIVFPIFLIFVILSLLIFFFFQNSITGVLQIGTLPLQKWVYGTITRTSQPLTPQEKLQEENNTLRTQLAKMHELERDNKALKDQFQTSKPTTKNLLPADVIGLQQDKITIDKGEQDNVHIGDIVVVKDNLIGKVSKTSPRISVATLISDPSTSFTAKTAKTSAIGVIVSQGGDNIFLGNVVLSDKLEKDDIVMTKGDVDEKGAGFPPDLVVGKIVSISKRESNLFQAAKLQSLVEFEKMRTVFVITQ